MNGLGVELVHERIDLLFRLGHRAMRQWDPLAGDRS